VPDWCQIFAVLTSTWFFFAQAYLAFFVIDDLQMAQSAKALVHAQSYQHHHSSDHKNYLRFNVCKSDLCTCLIDGSRFLRSST
jgi:hypothetical protein